MDRRAFLIATGGLLLGARGLPNVPLSEYEPVRYLVMPCYFDPYSATSWLELSDGCWQAMMFEVDDGASAHEYGVVEQYEKSLEKPGLNYEQVARAPRQSGEWIVRYRCITELFYLANGPRENVIESEADFWYEPEDAPRMSHAEAVQLALRMLRQMEDPDILSFYEPVRLDRAITDHENGARALMVDYLPTGYRRS